MSDDRIRMGVIVEGGSAPEWYWRQQIEAIEQERDALKAKLAEVTAERDALRKVELPEVTHEAIRSLDSDHDCVLINTESSSNIDWTPLAYAFVAFINKERGV